MLTWNSEPKVNGFGGTWLRGYCNLPLTKLAAVAATAGQNAVDSNNYYDPESGYDGWELFGTFNGQPFSLYTRYGVLKVGGNDELDVDALNAALALAVA
jgi:hypothetical protein